MPRFTTTTARAAGARGGKTTFERHGRTHMQRIGVRGFWTTVNRHFDGDARAAVNYLIALGIAATDPVPQNGAFEHNRSRLYWRARYGLLHYVRPYWKPPTVPDDMELPF